MFWPNQGFAKLPFFQATYKTAHQNVDISTTVSQRLVDWIMVHVCSPKRPFKKKLVFFWTVFGTGIFYWNSEHSFFPPPRSRQGIILTAHGPLSRSFISFRSFHFVFVSKHPKNTFVAYFSQFWAIGWAGWSESLEICDKSIFWMFCHKHIPLKHTVFSSMFVSKHPKNTFVASFAKLWALRCACRPESLKICDKSIFWMFCHNHVPQKNTILFISGCVKTSKKYFCRTFSVF